MWAKDFKSYSLIETFSIQKMDLSVFEMCVYADVFTKVIH